MLAAPKLLPEYKMCDLCLKLTSMTKSNTHSRYCVECWYENDISADE